MGKYWLMRPLLNARSYLSVDCVSFLCCRGEEQTSTKKCLVHYVTFTIFWRTANQVVRSQVKINLEKTVKVIAES